MSSRIAAAEKFLINAEIPEDTIEKLAEKLVTTMEGWKLFCDKETAESIWVMLTFGAKNDLNGDGMRKRLGDSETAKRIVKVYEKYRSRLMSELKSIRYDYDEVVDCDWNLTKINKSSLLGTSCSNEPLATLNLRTLAADEVETNNSNLTFDEVQLQDFLWRIKEAQNMAQNLKKL